MKRLVIIGATSGIGLEVAKCYLQKGWKLGLAGRRTAALNEIRQRSPELIEIQTLDVTHDDAPARLNDLIHRLGGMDVFLLSSGIGFQNPALDPTIELNTARTNVEGFTRMVDAAFHYCAKWWGALSRNQFDSRHERPRCGTRLFSNQTLSEHLH